MSEIDETMVRNAGIEEAALPDDLQELQNILVRALMQNKKFETPKPMSGGGRGFTLKVRTKDGTPSTFDISVLKGR